VTVLRDGSTVATSAVQQLSPSAIIAMMAGRDIAEIFPRSPHAPGAVVLEVRNLAGG